MPQFDPSSFSSQIFWLAICFALIYFSMSKMFLPRIRDILKKRADVLDDSHNLTIQLQSQINEVAAATKSLKDTANSQYKVAIEQSVKQAILSKEEAMNHLKEQVNKMIEESKLSIAKVREDYKKDCSTVINHLINEIDHRFLNSNDKKIVN